MTWGFVTCGPNEALVVSGKFSVPDQSVFFFLKTLNAYTVVDPPLLVTSSRPKSFTLHKTKRFSSHPECYQFWNIFVMRVIRSSRVPNYWMTSRSIYIYQQSQCPAQFAFPIY